MYEKKNERKGSLCSSTSSMSSSFESEVSSIAVPFPAFTSIAYQKIPIRKFPRYRITSKLSMLIEIVKIMLFKP